MERNVEIYFKVDGIEQYITNLEELDDVLKQVKGVTDEATEATKEFQEQADDFDSFQQKLDTMEGSVKVLAGSIQGLAGAASLLGFEDNEFFTKLEENVIGIIALGEGAKNMAEGVRLLAQNQKLATIAQRAFNIAANANPYVLLGSAIAIAAGALLTYKLNTEEAVPPSKELKEALETYGDLDLQSDIDSMARTIENLRKIAFGEEDTSVQQAIEAVAEITQKIEESKIRQRELEDDFNTFREEGYAKQVEQVNIFTDEELQARIDFYNNEKEKRELNTDELVAQAILEKTLLLREEQDYQFQQTELLEQAVAARDKIISDDAERKKQAAEEAKMVEVEQVERMEYMIDQYTRLSEEIQKSIDKTRELQTSTTNMLVPASNSVDDFATTYYKAFNQFAEEPEVWRDLLIRDTTAAFNFMNDIATIFTKDSEKRAERQFKINKALSLSTTIINTAAGITDALAKDATFPGSRFISAAAVAASGAAQIATIMRQQFQSGGLIPPSPSTAGGGGGASISYSFGQQAGEEILPGQLSTGGSQQPIQAYVLVSDVNNAQEANNQIQNLARL